jgi:hypothetical protein
MLTSAITGHPQLGRRAEVPSPPIRHRYLAYPRQRFQRPARLRRSTPLHDRKVRRGDPAPEVTHVLQPSRPATLQDPRLAHTKAHMGRRGDSRFRPGVSGRAGYALSFSELVPSGERWWLEGKMACVPALFCCCRLIDCMAVVVVYRGIDCVYVRRL